MTIRGNRRHGVLMAVVCVLIGGSLDHAAAQGYASAQRAHSARSDAGSLGYDVFDFALGGSVSRDSNLSPMSGLLPSTPSDSIRAGYIGLCLDDPYSPQRIQADVIATGSRIDKSSCLGFGDSLNRALLRWHLGPRVSGSVKASRTQTHFQDQSSTQRRTHTSESYGIDADGWITGGWHVLAGVAYLASRSENMTSQDPPDSQQDTYDVGVKYSSTTGNDIAVRWRRTEADQDDRSRNDIGMADAEDYRQDDAELKGTWSVNAKWTLTGRVTYVDRRYDLSPLREFSGTAGEIGFSWRPASTINLLLSAVRTIEPWQSLGSKYRASHNFLLAPTWQATDEISVSAGLRRAYDDFPSAAASVPDREDKIDHAILSAKWSPTPNLTINASAYREKRSANIPLADSSATVGTIEAALKFF